MKGILQGQVVVFKQAGKFRRVFLLFIFYTYLPGMLFFNGIALMGARQHNPEIIMPCSLPYQCFFGDQQEVFIEKGGQFFLPFIGQ